MATRRWYYLVPADGAPRGLVHAIERHNLDAPARAKSGRTPDASSWRRGSAATLLGGLKRVAMEYSPGNAIPYVSRVDAGTVEAVRQLGVDVVSSGDLVQRFEAVWSAEALATHRAASERLYRIKDRAFDAGAQARRGRRRADRVRSAAGDGGVVRGRRARSPTPPRRRGPGERRQSALQPTASAHRRIGANEVVLLDLWGKLPTPGAVFADITWVGFTGPEPCRTDMREAFAAARDGRDAAVELVTERGARADASSAASKSIARRRDGDRARRLRGAVHPPHRPQPRAPRCTATASTWTTTRRTTSAG